MPVYHEESGVRSIVGVVGIDILWEQILFGQTEEEIIKRLVSSPPCQISNLTECQIDQFRSRSCVSGCNITTSSTTCGQFPQEVFR